MDPDAMNGSATAELFDPTVVLRVLSDVKAGDFANNGTQDVVQTAGFIKAKVNRCAERLKKDKLVEAGRGGTLGLTKKGETEVKRLRSNMPTSGERFSDG